MILKVTIIFKHTLCVEGIILRILNELIVIIPHEKLLLFPLAIGKFWVCAESYISDRNI
jgi:hypothetical protein